MSYSSVSILALIIIFIINYDIFDRNENSIPAHRAYRAFLISVSAYYVTDLLWGFLYEAGKIGLVYADTALYFVAMAYTILLWTRFVIAYLKGNRTFSRLMNITGRVIFAFQLLVILVNFFRPILFHFDEHGVYHAGVARYIILVAQTAMFLMTAAYAFTITLKSTGTRRLRHRTIGLFSIIMAVFDILQVCYSLLPMYAVGCLLGTCLLHSFVLESEKEEYRGDLEEKLRESLEKGNCFDSLTGLPSMTYFFELADAEKDAVLKRGGEPALLYMDFSGMKFYNRNHGFSEGDKLLKEFANLLVRFFGNDRCCRIGGDHFAAITEADGLEDRLHQLFRECRDMNGGKSLPVHVGIYAGTDGHIHASFACDRAKLACGELSGAYASCYHYYKKELSDDAERRQYIVENIDRAIAEGWIQVYYQPIIRAVNEKVCDEEALARWIDPVRGFLSPVSFIPALEDAGLIYKLDLHILEQVLGHIKTLEAEKLYVVPHSINLSRADFDACDIVEEIRRRVDEAGVSRDRITIEITESIIGADFDFIKEQVLRFRNLGFPVWMDDFGSGYSSLDVLQSIRFDLLKFDMSFMKKLDEGESAKVILTELMKMAASLGLETVCEGVETEEQVSFLQEIGCSKLQGYYYARPNPFSSGLAWFKEHRDALENPEETAYYESIGRVNLFDLGVVASEDDNSIQNTFDSIPIAILEVRDDTVGYVRSNRSYRDFIKRFFHVDLPKELTGFGNTPFGYGTTFVSIVKQCCSSGSLAFFDERMPDGSRVHSLARRINVNPVTGSVAIAIAVLSVTKPDESTTFADIARALAADYYNIYVIDLDTDAYIEYSSRIGGEELLIERHGKDFFETAKRDMVTRIYEEDKELFVKWVTKENVLRELDAQGVFTASYRLIDTGTPMYVNMKIMKMQGGNRIILGISVIDAQVRQEEELERRVTQAQNQANIDALTGIKNRNA